MIHGWMDRWYMDRCMAHLGMGFGPKEKNNKLESPAKLSRASKPS